jgi:hypothetical protein
MSVVPERAYFCPRCAMPRSTSVCPICEGRTDLRDVEEGAPLETKPTSILPPGDTLVTSAPTLRFDATATPMAVSTAPSAEDAHAARPATARRPRPSEPESSVRLEGQAVFEENLAAGYGTYVIAGIAGAGKTELIAALNRGAEGDAVPRVEGRAAPTVLRSMKVHYVAAAGRRLQFVDVAGEHYTSLHRQRQASVLTRADAHFLELLSRRMSGIVLLLNLRDLWHPATGREDHPVQIEVLAWTLKVLRFFACGGQYKADAAARFDQQVDAQVGHMTRRLEVPVLLLFSKADELVGTASPESRHRLQPTQDEPLFVARHLVPELFEALVQHCQHFRCDFVHSLALDPDSGRVADRQACGVQTSLAWLLDARWGSRWPRLPTRFWLATQQALDTLTGRASRWETLPSSTTRAS